MNKKEKEVQIALGVYIPTHCDVCKEKFKYPSHPSQIHDIWRGVYEDKVYYTHAACHISFNGIKIFGIPWVIMTLPHS